MTYILYDLNAMDPFVSDSNSIMLRDTKVIIQEIQRLITTSPGSIPFYRSYGLNLKQFLHYPLTKATATAIFNYVKERIETFVDSAEIINAESDVNFDIGVLYFTLYVRVKETQEVATISFSVNVGN